MSPQTDELHTRIRMPAGAENLLRRYDTRTILLPHSRSELINLSLGGAQDRFEVAYEIPGQGRVVEAEVLRGRNGVAVNMPEPYMRRRDPDCMVVADEEPSDKQRFDQRFGVSFQEWREEIFAWLTEQLLIVLPFRAGRRESVESRCGAVV